MPRLLTGDRSVLDPESAEFPGALKEIPIPPKRLYVIGSTCALQEGLAVIGARKATPYGIGCARRFAEIAAKERICIISGGALGCDSASHEAALECGSPTVAVLGGGCDCVYPAQNFGLFQRIIDGGGAVVSEREWDMPPMRAYHVQRNRLIAGLAKATLIVEAGVVSGTSTTAGYAMEANREVICVPGCITSPQSYGANKLIADGASVVYDDLSFASHLSRIYGINPVIDLSEKATSKKIEGGPVGKALYAALLAQQMTLEEIRDMVAQDVGVKDALQWTMVWLAKMQGSHAIAKYPSGKYGPIVEKGV